MLINTGNLTALRFLERQATFRIDGTFIHRVVKQDWRDQVPGSLMYQRISTLWASLPYIEGLFIVGS